MKPKLAHTFEREEHEHYCDPLWCSKRLFDVEKFDGAIWDPCCGFGTIPQEADAAGYMATGSDIVDRGYGCVSDFLATYTFFDNVVCNPPYNIFKQFATHALDVTRHKIAMLWIVPRLNAAGWLQDTPLARVWLLTPRPSMPPGHVISAGGKATGGTQDFCWLVWDKTHTGAPTIGWLRRDA
jgi:hypothetical protein